MTSRRLAPHSLSRRGFLLAGAATVLLTACGDDDSGDSQGSDDAGLEGEVQTALVAGFADGFRVPPALVAGVPQRAPVALVRTDGVPLRDEAPAQLAVTLTSDTGFESELTLDRHGDGIPVPYFPMTFTLDDPGTYRVQAHLDDAEPSLLTFEFRVVDRSEVGLIQLGDTMRPVDTPTLADARGVEPICTRSEPCPFHEVTLAEALTEGRPVAFLISTPGFCQTAICGPVLELLIEASAGLPDLRCVHAEVYSDPSQLGELLPADLVTEAVTSYGLEFEPSLVVADAGGLVTARLDYTWDRAELDAALAALS